MKPMAALVAVCLAVMPLAGCGGTGPAVSRAYAPTAAVTPTPPASAKAPDDYYPLVDYHWLPPVSSFVASRLQSDLRRVPPLLQQGCQVTATERTQEGEDYVRHIVAEAALLRLAET